MNLHQKNYLNLLKIFIWRLNEIYIRNYDKEVDGRVEINDRPFVDDINVDKIEAGIIVL